MTKVCDMGNMSGESKFPGTEASVTSLNPGLGNLKDWSQAVACSLPPT